MPEQTEHGKLRTTTRITVQAGTVQHEEEHLAETTWGLPQGRERTVFLPFQNAVRIKVTDSCNTDPSAAAQEPDSKITSFAPD